MRRAAGAFWLGAIAAAAVFIATDGTTFDARVTGGEARQVQLVQHVDRGRIGLLLTPEAPAAGGLHLTKRSWGIVTVYTEEVTAAGARFAGAPVDVRLVLDIPGAVTATNATAREGSALVWTALPAAEPAWVRTRAVNWPLVVAAAAAIGLSLWLRAER